MKITALRLYNVKRFAGRGIAIEDIGDGVNVLCAANEFGKSTSFEALHALFFRAHTGTPADIQRLKPYSGGNPLIEVDIKTADGRYRITKQYYGSRFARVLDLTSGRLIAQSDEAENFIAALIQGGSAGPAGLLWVRQGVTGLEKRTNTEEENEKQVRAGLLESVQGEVEAVTGGRRMASILDTTIEQLSSLLTATGRPKAGGRYAIALSDQDALIKQEKQYKNEIEHLRNALDKRETSRQRLREVDCAEAHEERRKALDAAQTALDSAKSHNDMLIAADAELNLARERKDKAEQELEIFHNNSLKAQEFRSKLEEVEHQRMLIINKRDTIKNDIQKARMAYEAAETTERQIKQRLAHLDANIKALETQERLIEKKQLLTDAEVIRKHIEADEAKLKLIRVTAPIIDELQKLEIESAQLRAIENAARPSVSVVYDKNAASQIIMDDSVLSEGEERRYMEETQLTVKGIGKIILRYNHSPINNAKLYKIAERYKSLLTSINAIDLAAAREHQTQAQELTSKLNELRARLSHLVPKGLDILQQEIAALEMVQVKVQKIDESPEELRTSLQHAEEARITANLILRETEPARAKNEQDYLAIEKTFATLHVELEHAETILGAEEVREERQQILSSNCNTLRQALTKTEANAENLRKTAIDLEYAVAALNRNKSIHEAAIKEISTLKETISGLTAEIRTRADEAIEEKWRETAEQLSAAKLRVASFEREIAILQKLSTALEAAKLQARELYLKPVMIELEPLLRLMFDDVAITFDDRTLLPHSINRNGQDEDVDRLSGGMREQLSILTRLAFAHLLAQDNRSAPIILDDALVYSDDERIEKMFNALHRQAANQQIIVFSCRQRAFQKLGGNFLQTIDWNPQEQV